MKLRLIAAACLPMIAIPQQAFARQPIPLSQPNRLIFDDEAISSSQTPDRTRS